MQQELTGLGYLSSFRISFKDSGRNLLGREKKAVIV
jgi:hypothetical protein